MRLRLAFTLALALLVAAVQHAAAAVGDNATAVAAVTAAAGNKTKGATAAQSMGIPVDTAALAASPELASVPVGPPPTDSSSFVQDQAFTGHINSSGVTGPVTSANSRTAAAPYNPIQSYTGFVRPNGRRFSFGGKDFWPAGTSWYNMIQVEKFTTSQIDQMMAVHWQNGVRVIRIFGAIDGYKSQTSVAYPTQTKLGVFSETALQRLDYCVYAAGKVGIRLIPTLVNFWADFGGIQFYVNSVLGAGKMPENFYTNLAIRNAFKTWLRKITQRKNTKTGRVYASDPTIFAWELCNECHTRDNVEINLKQQAGTMVYKWQYEMAGYLKTVCKVKQMVTNGNEGYRAKGKFDPYAPITYPFRNWMNTGLKGEDFNRNAFNPYLDFLTLHVYPSNWQIPANDYIWLNQNVIGDRAALAAGANKPLLFEEYGAPRAYVQPRDKLFQSVLGAATINGLAGSLVWEVWPTYGDDSNYDFGYSQAGGATVIREFAYQKARASGSPNPWKVACQCTDVPYPGRTCASIKSAGSCCRSTIQVPSSSAPYGYCQTTCGRCNCSGGKSWCSDVKAAGKTGNGVPVGQ